MTNEYIPSAFPILERGYNGLELTDPGMTLRDYFAVKVLKVFLQKDAGTRPSIVEMFDAIRDSYVVADAMLKARKEPPTTW